MNNLRNIIILYVCFLKEWHKSRYFCGCSSCISVVDEEVLWGAAEFRTKTWLNCCGFAARVHSMIADTEFIFALRIQSWSLWYGRWQDDDGCMWFGVLMGSAQRLNYERQRASCRSTPANITTSVLWYLTKGYVRWLIPSGDNSCVLIPLWEGEDLCSERILTDSFQRWSIFEPLFILKLASKNSLPVSSINSKVITALQ